jgi:transposase InsO family protein
LRIRDLAHARPRFGYLRIWVLLRREGWLINRKRVRRLYRLDGLRLRMRVRRRKHMALNRGPAPALADAQLIIEAWRHDYNDRRPHSSLGHLTPNEFVIQRQTRRTGEDDVLPKN